ncbi:GOLPH3/VPS74 family protein [Streptomyces sp. DHE17-7]|uniref:GOLPH3/VPS74 family protein n=1 Tax=Streptomyces sp. DHE17-7 TaxID=2759949 RepID=UPI0022EA4AAD|nr:GPP34 family phosphoprotein [Streptomyces sp. DHE17-7]MBJ6617835.1 GPP34 family phosphoprotein [Streptomyces sp. DHE17-7]
MSTAEDLFITVMDGERPVGRGDLSLALAGAELVDLIGAGAVTVRDGRLVPGGPAALGDGLTGEAAAALTRQAPYEWIEDWLWRRGNSLSDAYQAALEASGELRPRRSGRSPFGGSRLEPADTPASRRARDRWSERDPVLITLATVVGVENEPDDRDEDAPGLDDEAVTTVVAAVHDAVMELEAVRQRRTIENAAFANLWRGP